VRKAIGNHEPTFYNWKKKCDGLGTAELGRLPHLEKENNHLKQIVAELTLDNQMLQGLFGGDAVLESTP